MKDSEFPTVNRPGKNPGLEVSRLNKPGLYAVGGGLYLRVQKGGAKSWQYRFSFDNHIYTMGLGRLEILTLDKARKQAIVLTGQRLSGINPWAIRQTTKVKSVAESKRLSPRRSRAPPQPGTCISQGHDEGARWQLPRGGHGLCRQAHHTA